MGFARWGFRIACSVSFAPHRLSVHITALFIDGPRVSLGLTAPCALSAGDIFLKFACVPSMLTDKMLVIVVGVVKIRLFRFAERASEVCALRVVIRN